MTSKDIVMCARKYLGTPFHHQGRLIGVGIDCVGLVHCVLKELNISDYDYVYYPRQPDGSLMRHMRLALPDAELPPAVARVGDIVVFWVRKPDEPCHVGILTDVGMIHTYDHVNKVVEHDVPEFWKKRMYAAFRVPGLEQ